MAKKAQKNQGTVKAQEWNLGDKLSLNSESGVITASDDFLEATLADTDMSVEQFKKAQEHQVAVRAAAYAAAGKMVAEDAKENKDIEQYHLTYDFGHQRENIYFSPRAEDAESRVRDVTTFNEPNKGEVTKAMKDCAELFAGLS